MMISETHCTNRSHLKIPQYSIYETNHPAGVARGGTAIIIKNSIKHHETCKYDKDYLQATSVIVDEWTGPLTISAVYCPPRHVITKDQFQQFYTTLGNQFLAGGDYNAKHTHWGSRLTTPRGRELMKATESNNLTCLSTGQPTYWPTDVNKIPDLIDFCITKGIPPTSIQADSCLDLSSDHSPVLIKLSIEIIERTKQPTLSNTHTNWDEFKRLIETKLDPKIPLKNEENILNAVEQFNSVIQQAAWNSTPVIPPGKDNIQDYPIIIKEKIAEKRKIRKQWQTNRTPANKRLLNRAIQQLKEILNCFKNQGIQDYLKHLTPTTATDYSLWKATKKLKQPQKSNPPIRTLQGGWARNNKEKAKTFAEHLVQVFQPHPSNSKSDIEEKKIQQFLESPYQLEYPITPFKHNEIQTTIRCNLNPKKAPGYDLITGKILKELPEMGTRYITQIFNAILRTGYFPDQWKVAQVILILKPGKPPEDPKSYRPISLLPVLSKVFEKLLLARLRPHLDENKLIPDHQFGFRQHHATIQQIHRVSKKIRQDLEDYKYCSAAFLDITQAFDKVWHTGLLYKLRKLLPLNYFLILQSYLKNRHFLVKQQEEQTNLYPILSGVPQGSVLGPILYLLYTADLPTEQNVITATFADDTAILASHENPQVASQILQTNLYKIQQWLTKWRIKPNEAKSVHVTFTTRKNTCPPVYLYNHHLPQAEDAKYLGMHFDRRLTWRKHVFTKRKQLGLKLTTLNWLLGRNSKLSLDNKLLVYKTILKPIWTYGIQLWGTCSQSNIEILERYQSKVLRMITNAPWYVPNDVIRNDLGMTTIKEEIKQLSFKYSNRLNKHPNALARDLMSQPIRNRRLKRFAPNDLLDRF
jgi:exonuclease III